MFLCVLAIPLFLSLVSVSPWRSCFRGAHFIHRQPDNQTRQPTNCCSMTWGTPLVVVWSIMVLHLLGVELLSKIPHKNSPKLNKLKFYQTNCCSITWGSPLVFLGIFMVQPFISGKLLSKVPLKKSPKLMKLFILVNKCCSIIISAPLICGVNLVIILCI